MKKILETLRRKWAEYLLEIMVISVGILGGFILNNWNEDRINKRTEQNLLKSMKEEISANRDQLTNVMLLNERSKKAADRILRIFIQGHEEIERDELDSLLGEIIINWTYDPGVGILSSIKSSGQINIIQNPRIRSFISTFETFVIDVNEENLAASLLIHEQYLPMVGKYVGLGNRLRQFDDYEMEDSSFDSDYNGLFEDRAVENAVGLIFAARIDELNEEAELLKILEQSLTVVESEINN